MIKMEKCPYCEKSMPKHILVKHLAKSHPSPENVEVATFTPNPKKWYEEWDAGEIKTCAQCQERWPDKLMAFHLRAHGL